MENKVKYEVEGHVPSYLPEGKKWKLVWADEFDGPELDRTKWDFRLNFWGERHKGYTDQGIVFDGNSNIELHRTEKDGCYVSPQLQTGCLAFDPPNMGGELNIWKQKNFWPLGDLPEPKFMKRYGYFEVRCKFQKNPRSMWSAFWLQSPSIGTTYDPAYSGVENDIMEHYEYNNFSAGNIFGGYGNRIDREGRVHLDIEGLDEGFHTFALYWSEKEYIFYCDGKEISRATEHISKVPQFILLTTEVKGYRNDEPLKIGEEVIDRNSLDGSGVREKVSDEFVDDAFVVDYVRVFDEVDE